MPLDPAIAAYLRTLGPVRAATAGGTTFVDPVKAHPPGAFNRDGAGLLVGLSAIDGITPDGVFDDRLLAAFGGVFWLQCPPLDVLPVDYSWIWNDYATVDSGMHSNPQSRQLTTMTFSSLLVDTAESYKLGSYEIPGPNYAVADPGGGVLWAVQLLKKIGDSMRPFQLQWGQPNLWGKWDGMMAATLRSFHVEERAGEIDARYFTVGFTEYPDAKLLHYNPPPAAPGSAADHRGAHTASNGQKMRASLDSSKLPANLNTLAALAKHYYGSSSQWRLIAKASGLTNVTASQDLKGTLGKRHPPTRLQIPQLNQAKVSPKNRGK